MLAGNLRIRSIPTLHYSITPYTPLLHYSITPLLHYSITPLLHYSITPQVRWVVGAAHFVKGSNIRAQSRISTHSCYAPVGTVRSARLTDVARIGLILTVNELTYGEVRRLYAASRVHGSMWYPYANWSENCHTPGNHRLKHGVKRHTPVGSFQ